MKGFFKKHINGCLYPIDPDVITYVQRLKVGSVVEGEFLQKRNIKMLRKYMALIRVIHEALPEPVEVEFRGKVINPEWTEESTRKWLAVKSGYYHVIGLPSGRVRIEADSISFAKMEEDTFEKLYNATIDAALKVLPKTWNEIELRTVAEQILEFA